MVDPTPIHSGLPRIQNGSEQAGKASSAASRSQGAAFEALLEKLDGQARDIQKASQQVARPEELAGAVDRARNSLGDALSLGNQLLEAFRANQLQDPTEESSGDQS
ncbi:MAG: hypothetical protein ACI841_004199 [Planctomycetota bacterium]|jgi:hypothetical protein